MDMDTLSPHALVQLRYFGLHPEVETYVVVLFLLTILAVIVALASMAIFDLRRLDHSLRRWLLLVAAFVATIALFQIDNNLQAARVSSLMQRESAAPCTSAVTASVDRGIEETQDIAFLAGCGVVLAATLVVLGIFRRPQPSFSRYRIDGFSH